MLAMCTMRGALASHVCVQLGVKCLITDNGCARANTLRTTNHDDNVALRSAHDAAEIAKTSLAAAAASAKAAADAASALAAAEAAYAELLAQHSR